MGRIRKARPHQQAKSPRSEPTGGSSEEQLKILTALWARSGELRLARIFLAAEPGAGAKTRLTKEEVVG